MDLDEGLSLIWTALELVGRLTPEQAARLTGWTPQAAGQRLRHLLDEGTVVHFQQAYWHPRASRRGSRHRAMVAEVYVRLALCWPEWRFERAPPGAYRPDGWLVQDDPPSLPIALEADRGTERRAAWQQKLERLMAAGVSRLLVVTPDAPRAARLREWLSGVPVQARVCTVDALVDLRPESFASPSASNSGVPPPAELPRARVQEFFWNGQAVDRDTFERARLTDSGVIGTERLSGVDRHRGYTRRRRRFELPRLR